MKSRALFPAVPPPPVDFIPQSGRKDKRLPKERLPGNRTHSRKSENWYNNFTDTVYIHTFLMANKGGHPKSKSKTRRAGIAAAGLVHVSDAMAGIRRVRRGKGFSYSFKNKKITDTRTLRRIRLLMIPPAWRNVWICPKENGHLQATGYDTRDRKQYLYHPSWTALRGKAKYYRLHAFGEVLSSIRRQVEKDLTRKKSARRKVLAAMIRLIEETHVRVGNASYEKLYGSHGLSTLKDQHVKLNGGTIRFVFQGKKGVSHDISIHNKRLARIVQHCREIPGKHLFQYYDEEGKRQSVDSGDINEYIKELSGDEFTSKDFRTWSGTVECLRALRGSSPQAGNRPVKESLAAAIDHVAGCLGNTPAVCRKYYIHPAIISALEKGNLGDYFTQNVRSTQWMDRDERLLMRLLRANSPVS